MSPRRTFLRFHYNPPCNHDTTQYGFSEGLQFPPFNRIIRRADTAPDGANDTALVDGEEAEADPTLTALKNAFHHATNGIKFLDAGNGSSVVPMGVGEEAGGDVFEIAYLAADASVAQAQQGEFGEVSEADSSILYPCAAACHVVVVVLCLYG